MKKIYLLLLLALLLSGCTLFEEDYDQVPHHTGEGYDKPVTETNNGVEMTYQFNDNVRILDQQEQQHIAYVEADATNMLMQVDFNEDTPDKFLPKKGEILVSKVSKMFPYGASHHVRSVKRVDGKYRCLLEYAQLKETFKELDMNGQIMFNEEGDQEYYVATRSANGDIKETRADGEMDEGFSFEDGKLSFKLPFDLSLSGSVGATSWSITFDKENNYTKTSYEFNFDDFSIREGKYNMKVIQTDEEVKNIIITGGIEKSGTYKKWKPVRGKTFTIGYIVVVFFVNIDISWSAKIEGSVTIKQSKKIITTHYIDLLDPSAYRKEVQVTDNTCNLGAAISGSFLITPKVTIGMGLYTKVFTVRAELYLELGFEATAGAKTNFDEDGNDINIADGPTFEVVARICVQVRFVADLSFEAILGPAYDAAESLGELLGKIDNETFFWKLTEEAENQDEINDDRDSNEHSITIGPWKWYLKDIVKGKFEWSVPWYPQMDDKSFKVVNSWDQSRKNLVFNAEFKIRKPGVLSRVQSFYPALRIMKGSKVVKTVNCNKPITSSTSKSTSFTFSLKDLEDGVSYTAIPCYRQGDVSAPPTLIDRGLTFCTTRPALSIVQSYKGETTYDEATGMFTCPFYTVTNVIGAENLYQWGIMNVDEWESLPEDQKDKALYMAKEWKDGTYNHKWTLRTNKKKVKLRLRPFCRLWKNSEKTEPGDMKLFEIWEKTIVVNEYDFSE